MASTDPSGQPPISHRPNSLGVNPVKLDELLDILDKKAEASPPAAGRVDARWPFRQASVRVRVEHPGGSRVDVRMICRNVSRTGAGLLHSSFIYPGTRCEVALPHPDLGETPLPGVIMRCMHRAGVLHEVGVRFDRPIDIRSYVRPDPAREWFSVERANERALRGTLLYIEDNPLDVQIVRHYLRDTQVRLRVAGCERSALERAREGADLILCDYHVHAGRAPIIIARLRESGIATPVVLVSRSAEEEVLALVNGVAAQAFLSKPLSQQKLVCGLAEFLDSVETRDERTRRSVDRALLASLAPELIRCAGVLDDAVEANAGMDALSTCMQLRNVAPSIGMHDIMDDLNLIVESLSGSLELAPIAGSIARVAARCRAAA